MRFLLLGIVILASAGGANAQTPSLAGTWRGTSLCTAAGRPACHDETVVHHLRALPDSGSSAPGEARLEWVMNKIVAGAEEEMGTLSCTWRPSAGTATCPMRGWSWRYALRGDTLAGTLANPDGVVWRNLVLTRAKP